MAIHTKLSDFEWHGLCALLSKKGISPQDRKNFIVLSREFTGVGSYTKIEVEGFPNLIVSRETLPVACVEVEGLANGMTLILWLETDNMILLEAVTHGESMPSEPVITRLLG